MYPKHVELRIH